MSNNWCFWQLISLNLLMNRDQVTGLVISDCWGLAGAGNGAGRGRGVPAAGLGVGFNIDLFHFIYSILYIIINIYILYIIIIYIIYIYYQLQISGLQGESVPARDGTVSEAKPPSSTLPFAVHVMELFWGPSLTALPFPGLANPQIWLLWV